METNRCKVKMGVILCKHCDSVIDTLDTEKATVYYLNAVKPIVRITIPGEYKEARVMTSNRVLFFHEGNAGMKHLLGGKGANLAEMTNAGLPVPPGFTVTTEACRAYYAGGQLLPEGLFVEIRNALMKVEKLKGQSFGGDENPLLVSVRSGSVNSMPGMMDTILNLGLNDVTVEALARQTGNPRFAYDCYRRLIQMFGNVVFDIEGLYFESLLHQLKQSRSIEDDKDLRLKLGWS